MNERLQAQLMQNVVKLDDSDCWSWQGQISNSGHGRMKVKYDDELPKMDSARNVSYRAFRDDIPEGWMTRPNCGNLYCVNPQHLEAFDPTEKQNELQGQDQKR